MEEYTDNSKERILMTATKLFAEKGFEGTSIREICKIANANICSISYYWGGKQELYQGIIDNLIEHQSNYVKTFIDFELEPNTLEKQAQIDLLMNIVDKFIDFFYSNNISKDLIMFLLREQQSSGLLNKSPVFKYLRKLIAVVFNKDEKDKEIIFKTLFIISQINSSRIMPAFSLKLLGQDDFVEEDIKIIRENVRLYVTALLKEANIV